MGLTGATAAAVLSFVGIFNSIGRFMFAATFGNATVLTNRARSNSSQPSFVTAKMQ